MNSAADWPGIIIISHGSPRPPANQAFVGLVERIATRLEGAAVLPAFFSNGTPTILDQVAVLAAQGVRQIALVPYFLSAGQHVTVDIPVMLGECRRQFPETMLELLPTLEDDPVLEDLLVERLTPLIGGGELPSDGPAIEARSFAIIGRQMANFGPADPGARRIVERVVHATADLSFARTLRIHPQAVLRGLAALGEGRPVFCDVKMLQAGMTRLPGEAVCIVDRDEVADLAKEKRCTRAAAAMEILGARLEGAIVAIGNAPTALWKVLEMARGGGPRPALVVGLPVGLVGAREAKQALLESDLCYITNVGPRGGSPVAAAAVNALATLRVQE